MKKNIKFTTQPSEKISEFISISPTSNKNSETLKNCNFFNLRNFLIDQVIPAAKQFYEERLKVNRVNLDLTDFAG